jgi:hypothetical protein
VYLIRGEAVRRACSGRQSEVVPAEANVVARRRTTPLFGLDLVDAVPDENLREIAGTRQSFTRESLVLRGKRPVVRRYPDVI